MTSQYIITEDRLDILRIAGDTNRREAVYWQTKESPYNPQAERERVLDEMIVFCESRMDGYIISLETMDEAQYQFQRIGRVVDELGVIQRKLVELREGKGGE